MRKRESGSGSPPASASTIANLEVVELRLELLDGAVCHLQILVEAVTFRNELQGKYKSTSQTSQPLRGATYMLFPLSEPSLLGLDLLSESLPQLFLFFLELRILQLLDLGFAELTRLHLLLTVTLVVRLFGRRDQIQHECAYQERPEFSEVTVLVVLDCDKN